MEIPIIEPMKVQETNCKLIDVRSTEEFYGELGHVPGSELITLGEDLDSAIKNMSKEDTIVFICRSGNRSGKATLAAMEKGFKNVFNMRGGMLLWNELGLEVEK